jgi:endonuclease YncB( thermonuclease family)
MNKLIRQQLIGATLTGLFFVFVLSGILYTKNAVGAYTEPSMDVTSLSYTCKRTHGDRNHYAVCDGDTFKVNLKGEGAYAYDLLHSNLPVRLFNIDSPEYYSPRCASELKMALQAKDLLTSLLMKDNGNGIQLVNAIRGKYFRVVTDVHVNGENIKQKLIDSGLYTVYTGRTKRKEWCTEEEASVWVGMDSELVKADKRKIVLEHKRMAARRSL